MVNLSIVSVILLLAGGHVFEGLGMAAPAWLRWLHENATIAIMGPFMLSRFGGGALTASGAFEVLIDGKVFVSKLRTGSIPTVEVNDLLVPCWLQCLV